MADLDGNVRQRFRAPDGHLLLWSVVDGFLATHALLAKETDSDRWKIIDAFETQEAAAEKLEHHAIRSPTIECVIIECEPY